MAFLEIHVYHEESKAAKSTPCQLLVRSIFMPGDDETYPLNIAAYSGSCEATATRREAVDVIFLD